MSIRPIASGPRPAVFACLLGGLLLACAAAPLGAETASESLARRAEYRRVQLALLRLGPMHRLAAARERERAVRRGRTTTASAPGGARSRPVTPDDFVAPAAPAEPFGRATTPLAAQAVPANVQCNATAGDGASAAQSETAVAALGAHVVVAWNDGQGFNDTPYRDGQGFGWSADGGVTFTDGGDVPHPAAYPAWTWTSDPVLAVNERTGEFWYCGLADPGGPNGTTNAIAVARGRFSGGTFAFDSVFVVRIAASSTTFLDKQWLACDSLTGHLYVSNTTFTTTADQVDFQRSTDGGRTWSAPQKLSAPADDGAVQGSRVAVGPAGEVHAVWSAIEQDPAVDTDHFRYRRSTDGGATFGAEVTCVDEISNSGTGAPGFNRNRGITFPSLAVDRTNGPRRGRVYVAWNESFDWLDDTFPALTAGIAKTEIESNGSAATATAASVGQVLRGTLATTANTRDQDWFALPLAAGQHVVVFADSFSSSRGFTLRLFAPSPDAAQMLAYGGKTDSTAAGITSVAWTFTAPASGTYYLRVAAVSYRSMGYRVRTVSGVRGAERGRDQRDAFVSWSDGASWATPVRVNDDAVGYDNWLPEVTVGADGMPYVTAYDHRNDTYGSRAHLYLSRSADGGATWAANQRLTSVATNFTTAVTNMAPNTGDYLALGAGDASVHAAWADGRNANVDVFACAVPTTSAITTGPADTTLTPASAADFGWTLANANPVFGGAYAASWSSTRAWPLPAPAAPALAAGGSAWQAATIAVPDTAAAGVNTICLTLTGPGGVVVGSDCFTITVPAGALGVGGEGAAFALGASTPNPTTARTSVTWALPRAGHARLALYDLAGARVRTLHDAVAASGRHASTWDGRDDAGRAVRAGAYFWSLEFDGRRLARRVVIVR
ncbi:MAG: FlgD immunoglobulin-like domain containing protein [Candidatus Eisenbacteria bacterium]